MIANPLALAMTGFAVAGVTFTLVKLVDDWLNYQAIRKARREGRIPLRDGRWWVALASLVSSIGQLCVWFGFCAIGVLVLLLPTVASPDHLSTNLMILQVLLCMELVLFAVQVWQIAIRAQVRRPRVLATVAPVPPSVDVATIQPGAVADIVDAVRLSDEAR